VARISFVSWSSTRIFQTGGPVAGGTLSPDAPFPEARTVETEGSTGVLRLSMESSAFVCACCTVTGEVAYGERRLIVTLEGKPYTTTDLFECMARHGGRVQAVRSDDGGASVVGETIEHSHGRLPQIFISSASINHRPGDDVMWQRALQARTTPLSTSPPPLPPLITRRQPTQTTFPFLGFIVSSLSLVNCIPSIAPQFRGVSGCIL
jgi:hypothetical protein